MTTAHLLNTLFPVAADIPEQYRLDGQVEQREYLVDGQLQTWNGPWPWCAARCTWTPPMATSK